MPFTPKPIAPKIAKWSPEVWALWHQFWRPEGATDEDCWGTPAPRYTEWAGMPTHRIALLVATGEESGEQPDGTVKFVLHRCGNKWCRNPAHLYLGTHSDNIRDSWRDGAAKQQRRYGEGHYRHWRKLRAQGWTCEQIAAQAGCTPEMVSWVWTGARGHHALFVGDQPYLPKYTREPQPLPDCFADV